jgi:hypothetical protein
MKAVKYLARVYKRVLERFFGAYFLTNTHVMAVVERPNMCVVPVYSIRQNTSIIEAVWHKLRAGKQSILEPGCINVNLSDFWMTIA